MQKKRRSRKKKKTSFWGKGTWLLYNISQKELDEQVYYYRDLTIVESARGLTFLFCITNSIITLLIALLHKVFYPSSDLLAFGGVFEVVVFIMLGFLILAGRKWAIVWSMIFWTLVRSVYIFEALITSDLQIVLQLFWWFFYMHALYATLRVEDLRKERDQINSAIEELKLAFGIKKAPPKKRPKSKNILS